MKGLLEFSAEWESLINGVLPFCWLRVEGQAGPLGARENGCGSVLLSGGSKTPESFRSGLTNVVPS